MNNTFSYDRRWFPFGLGSVLAETRLFCLPFAGGSASFFMPWRRELKDVAVAPLQYPGRETRFEEPCCNDLSRLVDDLANAIFPQLDRPYALLGYSLGAKIGFALCHRLVEMGASPPYLFIPVAHGAPDAEPFLRGAGDLSHEEFKEHIMRYGGMPDIVFEDPDLMRLLVPVLRSDIRLVEHPVPSHPLSCRLVAYAGTEDMAAPPSTMEEWRNYTTSHVLVRAFAGGHFFARSAENFLATLASDLAQAQPSAVAS
jgi:surfactin synthase thioesterase subunit